MVAMTVEVEGLSDLLDGLDELPQATETNVIKRALLSAADPIAEHAKRLAPRLTGALQMSISPGTKLSRRQKSLYQKESEVEVFVGPAALVQAITQEFGTVSNRPQPFMRPAWDAEKSKALLIFRDELADEIEKARARIARKQARLIAAAGG
jgi:HK97 gp10 family phage protein